MLDKAAFLKACLRKFRLHLVECRDELIEVLSIEHDGRLLAAAALLRDLEELAVAALLEVDVEGALLRVDRHAVKIVREGTVSSAATLAAAVTAAVTMWTWSWCRSTKVVTMRRAAGEFRHRIKHN